ncbi:hypothetical protein [Adhaeribacter soli]|uniref:hypothetical protein n=1 Tax=Adhaeribacter soli TaxID=2607655 RepID=UPI00177DA08F|nr:hypothetical protein [Adhaeribacter soli]
MKVRKFYFKNCKRLSAGILMSVIALSLVVAIILSCLILLAYSRRIMLLTDQMQKDDQLNLNSGLSYALAETNLRYNEKIFIDLFDSGRDSIEIEKKYWGIFDILQVRTLKKERSKVLTALVGSLPDSIGKSSLYLVDMNMPLSVANKAYLSGPMFLPKAGIKRVSSNGESDISTVASIFQSRSDFPKLDPSFTDRLRFYDQVGKSNQIDNFNMGSIDSLLEENRSFQESTLVWRSNSSINLQGKKLIGNIIIYSPKEITFYESTVADNIIAIAPKITFKENFSGKIQVFSTDTIIVESGCQFNYPSVLSLFYSHNGFLSFGPSRLKGFIITTPQKDKTTAKLVTDLGAEIEGVVCANSLVQLEGIIKANVIAAKFLKSNPAAYYENYIGNVEIDISSRTGFFITSSLLNTKKNKRSIIKWLN